MDLQNSYIAFLGTLQALIVFAISACSLSQSSGLLGDQSPTASSNYLYVTSGACYGGGVATAAPANAVVRYSLSTGEMDQVLADYTVSAPDSPSGVDVYDSDNILVAIENGGNGRRIDLVNKNGAGRNSYLTNTAAFTTVLHGITYLNDGGVLVNKTTAIEKFGASTARILSSGNPYINAPAGNCATSTTEMVATTQLSNGNIIYAHAGATPNNKIGIINSNGYNAASDCFITTAVTGPTTTALPTSLVVHPSGYLLVAYGSTTTTSNSIYAYTLNVATSAVSAPVAAYTDTSVINGISAMAVDPSTQVVYVANALSSFNTIEAFTFNASTKTLTRIGTQPFINASLYTKCISGMVVSN